MTKRDAFKVELPKWPQCIVVGETVSKEQALEIIRRTDSYFYLDHNGNNLEFEREVDEIIGKPKPVDYGDIKSRENFFEVLAKERKEKEEFERKWGCIKLEYLSNDWVSCSWVGGVHGWMNPDGKIFFSNNIGKWPVVEDVYKDLAIIGNEFPFLDMTCTLMSGEECESDNEKEPLVTMHLKNGKIKFETPTVLVSKEELSKRKEDLYSFEKMLKRNENYFPLCQFEKWAEDIRRREQESKEE